MSTKNGICLNAKTDDIPTQGRIAGGVHGISLRDGDSVAFMTQMNGEGEVVIATTSGKFKRVISSLIDPMARNRKGTIVVGLNDGEEVLYANYVTVPYMLAVVEHSGVVSELSTEDVMITIASAKARKIARYAENSVKAVYALPYKKAE